MDARRFDTIVRLFASRGTRRSAVAGGLGLAGVAVTGRALAQEGTPAGATPAIDPADPHPSADDARPKPEFLFVQPFDAGTWAPKPGEEGVYILTLTGAAAQTVYFSDRPERVVGLAPMQQLLDGLGFTPANPPNAALVAQTDDGEQDIIVIELLNPAYDVDAATLTYDARVLADYGEPGLAHLARQQQDYELGETFGAGSLFIDDCPVGAYECVDGTTGDSVGVTCFFNCWVGGRCTGCDDVHDACMGAFPDQCGQHVQNEEGQWTMIPICDATETDEVFCDYNSGS